MKIFGHVANMYIMRHKYCVCMMLPLLVELVSWIYVYQKCTKYLYLQFTWLAVFYALHLSTKDILDISCVLIFVTWFPSHNMTLHCSAMNIQTPLKIELFSDITFNDLQECWPPGQTTSKISCWILSNQAAWLPVQDWVISHSLLDLLPRIQMSPKTWVCVKQYGWHHPGPKGHCRWHHPRPMCV